MLKQLRLAAFPDRALEAELAGLLMIDCQPSRQDVMRGECIGNLDRLRSELGQQMAVIARAEKEIADIEGAIAAEEAREAVLVA